MLKNWNEESRQARNTNEITEIEEFYRPYMDQYNNRGKELERLMQLYGEYFVRVKFCRKRPHKG